MLADAYIFFLNRSRNCFPKQLHVYRIREVWQVDIYTAEPSIPDPVPREV
jgi:hypothetical protein